MLLALGLAAFSAAGQNVTVIMKDGTSHKFNADYLSELSFKDVQQGPETVEFKSILVEPYSNGNVKPPSKTRTAACNASRICTGVPSRHG